MAPDDRLAWFDEELEQGLCCFQDSSGRAFWHLLTTNHSVGATVGASGVEVPQIQFLDAVMVGCWRAWRLVRQWIHGLRQFLGACGRFFTFRCEGLLGS